MKTCQQEVKSKRSRNEEVEAISTSEEMIRESDLQIYNEHKQKKKQLKDNSPLAKTQLQSCEQ